MRRRNLISIATGLLLVLHSTAAAQQLDQSRFDELKSLFKSETEKPWRSIDWNISLLAAQNEAAEQGKPIFIWAMDGHPLGCT